MSAESKQYVIIVNDGPYGDERPYNAFRIGMNLIKQEGARVQVFLIGDGVQCGIQGQETPEGYYNIGRMARFIGSRGEVAV